MGDNLPPSVSVSDSDAPWNQDYREPDYFCPHCGCGLKVGSLGQRSVEITEFRSVVHKTCRNCGEVVKAFDYDVTSGFLKWMRENPEDALKEVDGFQELKQYE